MNIRVCVCPLALPPVPLLQLSSLRGLQASSSTQLEDQEHLVRGLEAKVAERDERIEESQVQFNALSREADNLR